MSDHVARWGMVAEDWHKKWCLSLKSYEFLPNGTVFIYMSFDDIQTAGYLGYFVGIHKMLRITHENVIHQT